MNICVCMFFNHLHSAMAAVWPHKIKKLINIILLSNLTCITMITKQTNISYTITLSPKVDNGVGPWSYDITVLYKSAYKYCYFTLSSKWSWGMTKITLITKLYSALLIYLWWILRTFRPARCKTDCTAGCRTGCEIAVWCQFYTCSPRDQSCRQFLIMAWRLRTRLRVLHNNSAAAIHPLQPPMFKLLCFNDT